MNFEEKQTAQELQVRISLFDPEEILRSVRFWRAYALVVTAALIVRLWSR